LFTLHNLIAYLFAVFVVGPILGPMFGWLFLRCLEAFVFVSIALDHGTHTAARVVRGEIPPPGI
jgi:hypothetical protein